METDLANPQTAVRSHPDTGAERIPFNDLSIQWREISSEVQREFGDLFAKSAFSAGPFVKHFEESVAAYLGTKHALAVNSGTSALHLAVLAARLGPGDEILVPSHTFIATIWSVLYVGATPVLCDVDPHTGNIDIGDAARRVSSRTTAIIPVHLYGQPADMDAIDTFATKHSLIVIEDNAQSIGARWNGRHLGTLGQFGCFSFYPGKNLGAAGEGGLVTTDDSEMAKMLRTLHNHGQSERYVHQAIGYNYRMDGIQGVVLRHKLKRIDSWTARRKELAKRYQSGLSDLPLDVPRIRNQDHVWHLFVVRCPKRNELSEHLAKAGIETGLHYPIPCHRQPCLQHLAMDRNSYPQSDRWAREGLSLPLFYGMSEGQVDRVVREVRAFFAS